MSSCWSLKWLYKLPIERGKEKQLLIFQGVQLFSPADTHQLSNTELWEHPLFYFNKVQADA